jgi:hypothetical protein
VWEWRGAYRVLVGKPKRKRRLVTPRRRWEENIKIDLKKKRVCIALMWIRIGVSDRLL